MAFHLLACLWRGLVILPTIWRFSESQGCFLDLCMCFSLFLKKKPTTLPVVWYQYMYKYKFSFNLLFLWFNYMYADFSVELACVFSFPGYNMHRTWDSEKLPKTIKQEILYYFFPDCGNCISVLTKCIVNSLDVNNSYLVTYWYRNIYLPVFF